MESSISNLDLIVIIIYLLIVVLLGIWASKKTKSGDDLFLGGRTFTWGFIGLSLFASNISSTTIIGLTGAAYSIGIVQSVDESLKSNNTAKISLLAKPHVIDWVQILKVNI